MQLKSVDSHVPDSWMRQWLWVAVFAVSFAWVESAIVVYLREIYYNGSFSFPLIIEWQNGKYVEDPLMRIEFFREIATIIMLAAMGAVSGKNGLQRFCYFMIAFGIWDIFYYVWLWVMISWPESLMTWDLLFFVPLPWVGPVITPVLIAIALVTAGSLIIYFEEKGISIRIHWYDWVIELGCALILITAFCWDWKNIIRLPDGIARDGVPNPFAWWLYLPAYVFSLVYFALRMRQSVLKNNGPQSGVHKYVS